MNNSTTSSKGTDTKVSGNNLYYRTQLAIIAQVTSLAVLGVIILFGNLASIITFLKTQSLRRRSYYLVICLSIADLFVGVVDFMCVYFFWTGPQWNTFVIALEVMDTFTGIASILTLSNISIERFYAIIFPFRHRLLRHRVYVALCISPWITSTYISTLYVISYTYGKFILKIYTYHIFTIGTFALFVISVSYITIGVKMKHNNPKAQNQNRSSSDQKLAITLLIVTLASLVTWLPLQCFLIVLYFCKSCTYPHFNVLFTMKFLQFCNSGINVFIYIVRMPEFRNAFLALICGKKGRNLRGQESIQMTTASIKNNLEPTKVTQSTNYRNSYQFNNSSFQNAKSSYYKTSPSNQKSRHCPNGNQNGKESVSHRSERSATQEQGMIDKAESSLDKFDIEFEEVKYQSAPPQSGTFNMEGFANNACETEENETESTQL